MRFHSNSTEMYLDVSVHGLQVSIYFKGYTDLDICNFYIPKSVLAFYDEITNLFDVYVYITNFGLTG